MLNGWVSSGDGVTFYKNSIGQVVIDARLSGGITTNNTILFELPLGFRPQKAVTIKGISGDIYIVPNGKVTLFNYSLNGQF